MRNLEDDHTALMGTLEKRAEEIQALGASNVERRAELESTRGRVTTLECQVTEENARLKTMDRTVISSRRGMQNFDVGTLASQGCASS